MATAEQKIYAGTHSDYFLKLGDIKGESMDAKHKQEINVLSWSFGSRQPGASAIGGQGAGVGKVQFHDFMITKHVDAASPKLMLACASGQHFPTATLVCRKAGGTQVEYLTLKFTNVIVSSQESASSSGDLPSETQAGKEWLPIDKITLNYAKIEMIYVAQDDKGSAGASTMAGWNLQTNEKS